MGIKTRRVGTPFVPAGGGIAKKSGQSRRYLSEVLDIWRGQHGKIADRTQFKNFLTYEISCKWTHAAQPGLAALAVVLERDDFVGINNERADRLEIFCALVDQLYSRTANGYGIYKEGAGFPFTPEMISRLTKGEYPLSHLNDRETDYYKGLMKLDTWHSCVKAQLCAIYCINEGASALAGGKDEQASQWFDLAIIINPGAAHGYLRVLQTEYHETLKERYIDAYLEHHPNQFWALCEKARFCKQDKRYAEAETILSKAIAFGGDEARIFRGKVRFILRKYDGAREDFQTVIEKFPDTPAAAKAKEVLEQINQLLIDLN